VNDESVTNPVHSIRAVYSILIALAVVLLVSLSVALLVGAATIAGQGMTGGIAVVGALIFLGVLAVGFLLSVIGIVLGWTAYRDPACKKLLPTVGLIFNGMALCMIVPGAIWILSLFFGR